MDSTTFSRQTGMQRLRAIRPCSRRSGEVFSVAELDYDEAPDDLGEQVAGQVIPHNDRRGGARAWGPYGMSRGRNPGPGPIIRPSRSSLP